MGEEGQNEDVLAGFDATYADSRYNIQLQDAYKAFMNGAGKCGKSPSLLEKQHKATRDQIRKAMQLEEDLIREDLCDEDHISASQDQEEKRTAPRCRA